jgi:putative flippase GtrA
MQGRVAEIGRYLLAGSANTLSTMAVYQLMVTISSPAVAYSLAWLIGLLIVAVAYPKLVFRVTCGWARGGAIAITYAVVFAVGLLLIKLLESLTIHNRLSIFLVLAVTTTMGYFGSRLAIARTGSRLRRPGGPGALKNLVTASEAGVRSFGERRR